MKKVVISFTLLTSITAHNKTESTFAGLTSLYCFSNSKIEKMTGKHRSTLSPKVIKAWKLGNLSFTYARYCGLAKINPMAIGDAKFHDRDTLNNEIQRTVSERLENQELADGVLDREVLAARFLAQLSTRMGYASRCEDKFVSSKGLGPLGKSVKEALSKNSAAGLLSHDISFGGACPGYREMKAEARRNLWVFVMMSMSHFESSCRDQVLNQGPYGEAVGLLQLHSESEDVYVSWDPDQNCDKGSSRNARKSLNCGLTMISNRLNQGAPFFDDGSHWQVLRNVNKPGTQAFQIRYALSQIPDCKANPLYLHVDLRAGQTRKNEVYNYQLIRSRELAMHLRSY